MGSPEAPAYTTPGQELLDTPGYTGNSGFGKINIPGSTGMPGGSDALNYAQGLMNNGLPQALKNEMINKFQGSLGGGLRTGKANLDQQMAQLGDVSIGAQQGAYNNLQDSANNSMNDFYGNLLNQDFGAQQTGFGDWNQLMGTAGGQSNSQNEYNMQKYQSDQANSFNLGNLLGSVIGAGGSIGGGMASKGLCCFIFMEAYKHPPAKATPFTKGDNLPWWVRECRDEFAPESSARREGYRRMADKLIPLMRSSTHIPLTPLTKGELVRWLVNQLMIKPMTKWGGWYKRAWESNNSLTPYTKGELMHGWIWKPVVKFWFGMWEIMGTPHPRTGGAFPSPKERGEVTKIYA